jgi:hypothetical protein
MSSRRSRKRRHVNRHDVEAIEQVLAERALIDLFLEILVGGGNHPHVDLDDTVAAEPLELLLLQDAQDLGLRLQLMSPTSSRKIVPLSACSNLPICRSVAPVNEPFSWPNSSDSISSSGIAAQLTWTNGRRDAGSRGESTGHQFLADAALPPDSTVALVGAAFWIDARTDASDGESPTI